MAAGPLGLFTRSLSGDCLTLPATCGYIKLFLFTQFNCKRTIAQRRIHARLACIRVLELLEVALKG